MKKILLAFVLLGLNGIAFADPEPPPVINDPHGFMEKLKELVDRTEPSGGAFYNRKDGNFLGYTGATLITGKFLGIELDGAAGYVIDKAGLLGVQTDVLGGVCTLLGWENKAPWLEANLGYNVGYSFEDDGLVDGPTVNLAIKKTW